MEAHKARMRTSSEDPNWRTPKKMVEKLLQVFPIQFDLAATKESRVVPLYFGPDHFTQAAQDSLTVGWMDQARATDVPPCGFLNPPYSISKIRELREELEVRMLQNVIPEEQEKIQAHYDRLIAALHIENWARKAFNESEAGFTTIGVFPYSPQTEWFRQYVMGHTGRGSPNGWRGHAALDCWLLPHRVKFERPDGSPASGANVNTCIINWGPNPGFVGPWVPSFRYWSYR